MSKDRNSIESDERNQIGHNKMSLKKSAEQFLENFQKIETRLGELGDQLDQDFVKSIADEGGNVVCGPTKIITYSVRHFITKFNDQNELP